jgi:pimeloyl-ACP methyl ester carboxylesterase
VVVVVCVLAATSVNGCTRVVAGRHRPPTPAVGAPLQWGDCDTFGVSTDDLPRSARCADLAVPVDYAKPGGDVAAVAVIKIPATGRKLGSLVMNPGGPGGSGVDLAAWFGPELPRALRDRFDIVGFDPRGVGHSRPAIACVSNAEFDAWRADRHAGFPPGGNSGTDYTPDGVAKFEAGERRYVQSCVERTGVDFLAAVGTSNVVKDLDALREALGDEQLTYLGYSYGTQLGASFAEAYPDRVRAMVLDGAVNPAAGGMQWMLDQAAGFQLAFDDYAADCARSPSCPLGKDPAKAVQVYHDLVDPLLDEPAPTADPRGLTYDDAITGTVDALYHPQTWTTLTDGLRAVKQGRDADDLLGLADEYLGRDEQGDYANSLDAYTAVTCADYPYPKDEPAWATYDQRFREVSPFQVFGDFTGYAPRGICAFWPVPATREPHQVSAHGLPTVLVISTTRDPATPHQDGIALANQLGARLLTFEGTQHTASFGGVSCVDDAATVYLIGLTLPPNGLVC